jgi:cleavage stimulation factor subunit 3
MRGAYEYVIAAVGQDGDASAIWHDYIDFIKSWPSTNQFEEGNRTAALRKVYQEAVTLPLDGVEQLWREWDQLENALNKILAKKLLNDKAQAYQYARQAVRERRARAEGLQRNALAVPFRGSLRERQQMDQWRALAEYEMV